MKNLQQVLKTPVLSEKSTALRDNQNQYVFEVHPDANKIEIKSAIESVFDVKVLKVNTHIRRGKIKRVMRVTGKRANRKYAIVSLKPGDSISFHEGL